MPIALLLLSCLCLFDELVMLVGVDNRRSNDNGKTIISHAYSTWVVCQSQFRSTPHTVWLTDICKWNLDPHTVCMRMYPSAYDRWRKLIQMPQFLQRRSRVYVRSVSHCSPLVCACAAYEWNAAHSPCAHVKTMTTKFMHKRLIAQIISKYSAVDWLLHPYILYMNLFI